MVPTRLFTAGRALSRLRLLALCPCWSYKRICAHGLSRPCLSRPPLQITYCSSRCTVSGEKAGMHTAIYSAPSGPGVL